MVKVRISSKGQVVLPKSVREAHGFGIGDELILEDLGDEIVLRSAVVRPTPKLDELRDRLAAGRRIRIQDVSGVLRREGPPLSVEDMDEGIAAAVSGRDARSRY